MDDDKLGRLTLKAWKTREGALVNAMMYLGHSLGLFAAMPVGETIEPAGLAERTGCDQRWLEEWLRCMAAADLVDSIDGHTFVLSPEGAAVLVDDTSPTFAGGAMQAPITPSHLEAVATAIRTGRGFSYSDLGTEMAKSVEAGFAPSERALLRSALVPAIPGFSDRLEAGGALVDVGCGTGHTLELLADAFPSATFAGYDPSVPATDIARERFAGDARVSIHTEFGHELPPAPRFDIALTFDCLHDMPRPDLTLAAIREAFARRRSARGQGDQVDG